MPTRRCFLAGAAARLCEARGHAHVQKFTAGIVPAGRASSADPVQTYWDHCKEVATLGFHYIEINNTRVKIAEAYSGRVSEFRDRMDGLGLHLAGLAQFSHAADAGRRAEVAAEHRRLGEFLSAVGGTYITHMIAPAEALNESSDQRAYAQIDLKTWAAAANEIGKALANEYGITLAYHPEREEIRTGLYEKFLAAADERYVKFLPDTGHLAAGGADVIAECQMYRARLACVHLKDFAPKPPDGKQIKAGNVPFGNGVVNLTGLVQALRDMDFPGYVMTESGGTNLWMRDYLSQKLRVTIS